MSAATSSGVSTSNLSLWRLPGLDKDTFYAAALLLSVAKGNINPARHYREPKTPVATRDFLDYLADCFARSKLQDRRDHVSATAMVRNEKQKTITLYIAKNQSEKRLGPLEPTEERGEVRNENEDFAKILIEWFNRTGDEDATQFNRDGLHSHSTIFKTMCDFNRSRLEHYIEKIREADVEALDTAVKLYLESDLDDRSLRGLEKVKRVITMCQGYKASTSDSEIPSEELSSLTCAESAGRVREDDDFQRFTSVIETLPESKRNKVEDIAKVAAGIKYLGRLFAAYKHFLRFCKIERRNGFSFGYNLLPSLDCTWDGDAYLRKIESWAEALNLREQQRSIDHEIYSDLQRKISDIVKKSNNKGSVHCEMQLLMHFSGPNAEKCEDYFGCSKKSCWLCWQMISKNSRYITKDTHRKIYPAWVFPFNYSASQPAIAEGLITAYNTMLSLVQEGLIKRTLFTFLEPLVQSSFRMTPAYRSGPLHSYSEDSARSEKFPEPLITVSDKLPVHSVKAVHLAEHGYPKTFRIVEIRAYEAIESTWSPWLNAHSFGDKKCVFAFQLKSCPESLSLDSEVEEYQRAFWSDAYFGSFDSWSMYYRTAETLHANPYISSLCAKTQPEMSQPIPWRGDIFIIQNNRTFRGYNFKPEVPLDERACLEALEQTLNRCSETWDTEKVAEDEVRSAEVSLELHKSFLLFTLKRELKLEPNFEEITGDSTPEDRVQRMEQISRRYEAAMRNFSNMKASLSSTFGVSV